MKKMILAAAVAAMTVTVNANAETVAENKNTTVVDVVMSLDQESQEKFIPMYQKFLVELEGVNKNEKLTAEKKEVKSDKIKYYYSEKFCNILDSEQNEVAINSISQEYMDMRSGK